LGRPQLEQVIGPPPVAQSYLQADRIIEVALEQEVNFIHPGYGLLSENADFAAKTTAAGITVIGPEADVIRCMGDKLTARSTMEKAGIPIIPGGEKIGDLQQALSQAEEIGYPVMLKASAGGGGIGLQMCRNEDELRKAYDSARSKAKAYFGNDEMFLETYIKQPRHIEVQIAADQHGQIVHLFERDCSIQRRHQKVIEESPSPFVDEQTRTHICRTAVQAASAVHYTGVGTVEFIVGEDKRFFFLEMNTRLQVEHPVTEEVTGIDLVALQLDIAEGGTLPFNKSMYKDEAMPWKCVCMPKIHRRSCLLRVRLQLMNVSQNLVSALKTVLKPVYRLRLFTIR
jgi:acetyl-CoA carboxylase, biotin carboxylase subunit